jgi:hypothetical protein
MGYDLRVDTTKRLPLPLYTFNWASIGTVTIRSNNSLTISATVGSEVVQETPSLVFPDSRAVARTVEWLQW